MIVYEFSRSANHRLPSVCFITGATPGVVSAREATSRGPARPGPASHESVFEGRTSTASMLKIVCLWGILTSGNGKFTNFEWKNHQFLMEDHQCLMENHQFLMEKTQVFFNGKSQVFNGKKHQFLMETSPVFNGRSPAFNGKSPILNGKITSF